MLSGAATSYVGEARADVAACRDYLCPTITVSESPPKVRIALPATPAFESCTVGKRNGTEPSSTGPAPRYVAAGTLSPTMLVFEDTAVTLGQQPEYQLTCRFVSPAVKVEQYHVVNVRASDREDRGVVLLVIDNTKATALAPELDRLENDLVDDGWGVVRELVSPGDTPPSVRSQIIPHVLAFGARLRSVVLLGAVPRVYSGSIAWDGHPDHAGAWPADAYYGDVNGGYTDDGTYGQVGTPSYNVPGDGKYDQSFPVSALETMIGRVDTEDLPAFAPLTATDLLRRYLDKNHRYRTSQVSLGKRVWLTNTFGGSVAQDEVYPPAYSASLRAFGVAATEGPDFLGAMGDAAGYSMAFGSGGGSPTSAAGVVSTTDFVNSTVNAGFLGLFGSYFGDYSYSNNLMRAALVGKGSVVGTMWFARPQLETKELAARGTFADMLVSMFESRTSSRMNLGLLGDPTLRLDPLRPPSAPQVSCKGGRPRLAWTASPDADVGYRVFRRDPGSPSTTPDVRVSGEAEAGPFVDTTAAFDQRYVYRVVPVHLTRNASGIFTELGPGVRVTSPGCAFEPPAPTPAPTGTGSGTATPSPTGAPGGTASPSGSPPVDGQPSAEAEDGCRITPGRSGSTSLLPVGFALAGLGALARRRSRRALEACKPRS